MMQWKIYKPFHQYGNYNANSYAFFHSASYDWILESAVNNG